MGVTLADFSNVFCQLAIQLQFREADEATIRSYYTALKGLDLELIAMAADHYARRHVNDKGEAWFPRSAEWADTAHRIERQRWAALRDRLRRLPRPACLACDDTGMRPVHDGVPRFVRSCECRVLRRLEVLGRRPWPALPEGES